MTDSTVSWMFMVVVALAALHALTVYAIVKLVITGRGSADRHDHETEGLGLRAAPAAGRPR